MFAVLLAAGLAAAHPSPLLDQSRPCNAGTLHTSADPALLMRPQDWAGARPRKLGELPRARSEYAVMRLVGGCMVPAPAAYRLRSK